jgi:hypothetical protein
VIIAIVLNKINAEIRERKFFENLIFFCAKTNKTTSVNKIAVISNDANRKLTDKSDIKQSLY